jgi:hypothetical protein
MQDDANNFHQAANTRRSFLCRSAGGLGTVALSSLLNPQRLAASPADKTHFTPKAKRVIFLFMSGGPSHMDLFDHKPKLNEMHKQELPASVRGQQRVTLMTRNQASFPIAGSPYKFVQCGQSGQPISELLPHTQKIVDQITVIRSMHTDPINHDPAVTFLQTGGSIAGRPCIGSWLSYGLGSDNADLPAFIVLLSGVGGTGQPILSRYWHSGFLPSQHQGVQFRSDGDPVLYLSNPAGITSDDRKQLLDTTNALNRQHLNAWNDPEIQTRIQSFELAYRMQTSVPDLMDISQETPATLAAYGAEPGKASFANNCLLARRLAERGVRFIQLYHRDWDHHFDLPKVLPRLCQETDQAAAALVLDLKERGLLDDTLIVWGGEFGRTAYCQGPLTNETIGRDHHPRCFTMWLAGGGIKPGLAYGSTDDFGYNVADKPVHTHDFQATLLHQLGIDHERLTYRFQGRDFRLTDVHGTVVKDILA